MRLKYREHRFICGEYLETDIYPVWQKTSVRGKRAKKSRPSTETQARLNRRNAERKIIRLLNTNFSSADIRLDLTYRPEYLPETAEDAKREMDNFLRRLKYYRRRVGLPELKYIAVIEEGSRTKRFHHHIVLNCGDMRVQTLAEIWGRGYTTVKALQFNESGITGIAKYLVKDPLLGKRWYQSRNLQQPEERTRDGYISQYKVREIAHQENDARAELERIYDGYLLTECKSYFNEINAGFYITVTMRSRSMRMTI